MSEVIKQAFPKPEKKKKKRIKKSALQKRKDSEHSSFWRNKADSLWYKIQHYLKRECALKEGDFSGIEVSEDGARCSGSIEIHHLIEKGKNKETRHMMENGIGLCSSHHKFNPEISAHQGQVKFYEFLRINFPDKHSFWLKYKWVRHQKYNYKESYLNLVSIAEELNVQV